MNNNQPKRKSSWSSLGRLLVFLLIIAGRPLANVISHLSSGANMAWTTFLPVVVGGGMLVAVIVAVARAFDRGPQTPSLPTSLPSAPPVPSPRWNDSNMPRSTRFEPVVSPRVLLVGLVGLVALVGVGVFVWAFVP